MNELALCHSVGLGLLGSRLLGWTTVAGCEINPRRRAIVMQRQRDDQLDHFPIWDDITTFDGRPFRGCVDIVTAGVPCPKWSEARHAAGNPPDLLGEALRIYAETGARYLLLENVRQFAREEGRIRRYLEPRCEVRGPLILDSAELGCPASRKRCWFLADAHPDREPLGAGDGEVAGVPASAIAGAKDWWQLDPAGLVRLPDGRADRMDRLGAAGDGQLPAMVVCAFQTLTQPN